MSNLVHTASYEVAACRNCVDEDRKKKKVDGRGSAIQVQVGVYAGRADWRGNVVSTALYDGNLEIWDSRVLAQYLEIIVVPSLASILFPV